ncbi:Regulator of RpoS [Emticicia aquatica]|jgi:DNA-binding response OmpR family regulator|uniref:Regulator of RpoS n=1 Tax=Emticicia aquatica TaxID=1681835 RepID=A0ABM9AMU3_9BACT|nr:response regulator [Emticicia aquatica]CAH0994804.1 Regulator of RpoS [Emticicia aquatica]
MKKRLLVIDDSEMILGLINYCLHTKFELFLCNRISNAQTLLQKGLLVDVIITDLNLPDENGKDFIRKIKSSPIYCHIPTIVISGEKNLQSQSECLNIGANDYISKPFKPNELLLSIIKQLGNLEKEVYVPSLNFEGNDITKTIDFRNTVATFRNISHK